MIVRLTNKKMKIAIMNAKKALRGTVVYINEHLTRETNALFAKARTMVNEKRMYGAWTQNYLLYIKLNESQGSKIIKNATTSDLDQY